MAATAASVREEVGDAAEPYLFSDDRITEALEEAAADLTLRNISLDTTLGAKAQRLVAARDLLRARTRTLSGRTVASVSEDGKSISYVDLAGQLERLDQDIARLLRRLGNSPMDIAYDNY